MAPIIISEEEMDRAKKAALIITQSLHVHCTTRQLARKVKLSEKKLKYAFKQLYGVGAFAYLQQERMARAKELMLEGYAIKLIIPRIGYESESNFCKAFRKIFKETPVAWKKKQAPNGIFIDRNGLFNDTILHIEATERITLRPG